MVEAMVEAIRAYARLCNSDDPEIALRAADSLCALYEDILLRHDLPEFSLYPEEDDFICDECAAADADDAKAELDAVIDSILNRVPIAPYPSTSYGRNSIFSQPFINDMPPVIICGFGFSEN